MTWALVWGVLSGCIMYGVPLLYATLGEVVGQRAGMVNLGLEGILLVGASVGFAVTAETANPLLGVAVAVLAGGVFNLLYAYLAVTRRANQLASGLALMFLGIGLSALIGKAYIGKRIVGLARYQVPGLSELPWVTKTMFNYDVLVYISVPIAIIIWWMLF